MKRHKNLLIAIASLLIIMILGFFLLNPENESSKINEDNVGIGNEDSSNPLPVSAPSSYIVSYSEPTLLKYTSTNLGISFYYPESFIIEETNVDSFYSIYIKTTNYLNYQGSPSIIGNIFLKDNAIDSVNDLKQNRVVNERANHSEFDTITVQGVNNDVYDAGYLEGGPGGCGGYREYFGLISANLYFKSSFGHTGCSKNFDELQFIAPKEDIFKLKDLLNSIEFI